MLAIRLQRTGRKGHAQYRVIAQDSHRSPTSGRVVAHLGSYDPHAKTIILKKDKIEAYISNGAQPSDRVARLLKNEGVKLPDWVKLAEPIKRDIRKPEKLRKNQPKAEVVETPAEPEAPAAEEVVEAPAETPTEEA